MLRRTVAVLVAAGVVTAVGATAAADPGPKTIVVYADGVDSPTCGSSIHAACRTIGQALSLANDGDTIEVGTGSYTESLPINSAITLTNVPSETPTLVGTISIGSTNGPVTVSGFTVDADTSGIQVTGSTAVTITDNTFAVGTGGGAAIAFNAPDPADSITATLGGNTGTVAAPTRTITETGDGSIAITTTASNTITPGRAPEFTFDVPPTVTLQTPAVAVSVSAKNLDSTPASPDSRFDLAMTGSAAIPAADLQLTIAGVQLQLSGTANAGGGITGSFDTFPTSASVAASGGPGTLSLSLALDEIYAGQVINTVATYSDTTTISRANHPPVAANQSVDVKTGHSVPITLNATDADSDTIAYTIPAQPTRGSLDKTGALPSATVTYTALTTGSDSFGFTASDGHGGTDTGTVTITVAANSAPVVTDQSNLSVPFDGSRSITLGGATDDDGDAVSYSITTAPAHGTLTPSGRTGTYTATPGFAGTDSFKVQGDDGHGATANATITVKVAKATTSVSSVTFSPAKPTSAQVPKATITLSSKGNVTGGTVSVTYGSATHTAKVSNGKAVVTLSKLSGGKHSFAVKFAGTATTSTATRTATLSVAKVASTLTFSTSPAQLTTKSTGRAVVHVSAPGATVTGAVVTIKSGSHVVGTAKIVGGAATIALPKLSLGQHNWTVVFAGSTSAASSSKAVVVRVALG